MTDGSISGESDLLVSIPRPRWRTIRRVFVFGSSVILSLAAAYVVLGDVLYHRGMTTTQRALLLGIAIILYFNALFKAVILRFSLKLPLEIFKSGIAFEGVKWPWEAIEGCRWSRYSPNTLYIRFQHLRHSFPIPQSQRATVEAALRKMGKWQC